MNYKDGVLLECDKIGNKKIYLFVCTGNTCRSPMCAALFNDRFAGISDYALSAGIYADGSPISSKAICALESFSVKSTAQNNYKNHISHTITEADIERADKVVCVSPSHMMTLIMQYPGHASKIIAFPSIISDPYGGDIEVYKNCLSDISIALSEMFRGYGNEI